MVATLAALPLVSCWYSVGAFAAALAFLNDVRKSDWFRDISYGRSSGFVEYSMIGIAVGLALGAATAPFLAPFLSACLFENQDIQHAAHGFVGFYTCFLSGLAGLFTGASISFVPRAKNGISKRYRQNLLTCSTNRLQA
jgi:hypothetical protein